MASDASHMIQILRPSSRGKADLTITEEGRWTLQHVGGTAEYKPKCTL